MPKICPRPNAVSMLSAVGTPLRAGAALSGRSSSPLRFRDEALCAPPADWSSWVSLTHGRRHHPQQLSRGFLNLAVCETALNLFMNPPSWCHVCGLKSIQQYGATVGSRLGACFLAYPFSRARHAQTWPVAREGRKIARRLPSFRGSPSGKNHQPPLFLRGGVRSVALDHRPHTRTAAQHSGQTKTKHSPKG